MNKKKSKYTRKKHQTNNKKVHYSIYGTGKKDEIFKKKVKFLSIPYPSKL